MVDHLKMMITSGGMKIQCNLMTKWIASNVFIRRFFKIDYNGYYTDHCESLQQQIELAEAKGFIFNCNAYSHIPALQQRMKHSTKTDYHYIHQTFDGLSILRCEELV